MDTESYADWDRFLANLGDRGLDGARLVVSDAHGGLKRAVAERSRGGGVAAAPLRPLDALYLVTSDLRKW